MSLETFSLIRDISGSRIHKSQISDGGEPDFSLMWSYSFMRIEPTPVLHGSPACQPNRRFQIYQLYNHISQFLKSL